MKKIIFFFLLLATFQSFGADAYFIFTKLNIKMSMEEHAYYASLQFTVNGTVINVPDKKYEVRINGTQLDTIKITSSEGQMLPETVLTVLRPGESYKVVYNPCSNFEIIPSVKHEGKKLVRLVSINKDATRLFLNSYYCFIDSNQVHNRDTTDYFVNHTNGHCPFALSYFRMCPKNLEDLETAGDLAMCRNVVLYFPGNEMFTLYYDYRSHSFSVKFDGYFDEKLNIKIGTDKSR